MRRTPTRRRCATVLALVVVWSMVVPAAPRAQLSDTPIGGPLFGGGNVDSFVCAFLPSFPSCAPDFGGFGIPGLDLLFSGFGPQLNAVSFSQIDWQDAVDASTQTDSLWGAFTFSYVAPTRTRYLNVRVEDPRTGQSSWVIENMNVFPQGAHPSGERVFFDLSEIGVGEGEALDRICYTATLDAEIRHGPPMFPERCADVASVTYAPGDHPNMANRPAGSGAAMGPPRPVKVGGRLTHLGNDRDEPFNQIEEGPDQCMAGAIARSLDWLDREYAIGIDKTIKQFYDELRAAGVTDPGQPGEHVPAIEGRRLARKVNYTDELSGGRIVTKVWDAGNFVDTPSDLDESTGDFRAWLKGEWETEDVELVIQTRKGSHIVTITDVSEDPQGNFKIRYRDDQLQDDPNAGDRVEDHAWLARAADGTWYFLGRDSATLKFAVSESAIPI